MTEFQTHKRHLLHLMSQIDTSELALPDFQRDFVWEPSATRELLSSVIRSFPAGSLLFLQGGAKFLKPRSFQFAPGLNGIDPPYLVLDGQQRLTSLYAALRGQGSHRYYLNIEWLIDHPDDEDIDEAVLVFARSRTKRWDSLEAQAKELILPLSELTRWGEWKDQVVEVRVGIGDDRATIQTHLNTVNNQWIKSVEQYEFRLVVLDSSTSADAVCTIFETLNRTGVKLSVFELITARAYADNIYLRDLWAESQKEYEVLSRFDVDPYYVLQVVALLEGKSPKRSQVLALKVETVAKRWNEAAAGLASALVMLRDQCGVVAPKWLPYQTILLTLGALWPVVSESKSSAEGARKSKLRRYFWCSSFSGRYENAPNTVAEQDVPAVRTWLEGGTPPDVVANFDFDPNRWRDATVRQRALYRATMALLVSQHPSDFYKDQVIDYHLVQTEPIDDHHVFPRNYLNSSDDTRGLPDSVLNHTLLHRQTNILISDKAPSCYLNEMRSEKGEMSTEQLGRILRSHCLPEEEAGPLRTDHYETFLEWRMNHLDELLQKVTKAES